MSVHLILFLAFGAVCVAGAVNLLAQTHPINSALSLIAVMAALAGEYLLLGAEFVASVQSADEHRTYEEMGLHDDVKRVNYAGRPQESEVSWWYFGAGKVYRFHNGRIEQVDRFTPVQRF